MARKADYSNTHKYDNRRSFDGQPVPAGKVLVPFRIDIYGLKEEDYIDENCTTMRLGDFRYHIGFMAIDEAQYASYMKDFWNGTIRTVFKPYQSTTNMTEKLLISKIPASLLLRIRFWTSFAQIPQKKN